MKHNPCESMVKKFFMRYKDQKLQQSWISEMKTAMPQFNHKIDKLLKNSSENDIVQNQKIKFERCSNNEVNCFSNLLLAQLTIGTLLFLNDPSNLSRKRWILDAAKSGVVANALSIPPGEYARKSETQSN